jgi:DNA-binding protein WhiA
MAINSMMEFEDARIRRDFSNNLNRFGNLEVHNQEKLARVAYDYDQMYQFVIDNKLEENFNADQLDFYKFKRTNLEMSLEELAENISEIGIEKTKSGLNH